MQAKFWVPLCGVLAVAACTARSSVPNGGLVIDETIPLVRGAQWDTATREVTVDGDALLVAIVNENLTDVRVRLAFVGDDGEAVEVENHLEGNGFEIATRAAPRGTKVTLTLAGPRHASAPGAVHLKLHQFVNDGSDDGQLADLLTGYQSWSAATAAKLRVEEIPAVALPAIDRAIVSLQRPGGDPLFAAEAQRIKANLYYRANDAQKSYEFATQSVDALTKAGSAYAVPLARAQLTQAMALAKVARDPKATHPPAPDAKIMARQLLAELGNDRSRLGRVERARATYARGLLDRDDGRAQDADYYLDLAISMFQSAGYKPPSP